ncbi:unnamed protein product [Pelagomonas calceolata]|uniref:Uncharacterized protein n=1 Tax=Pelagomonas calceolata TaxID=35677 RepID=A0A8J2SYP6_9STRA|nr:unnamed protein product [Pelagomonas calceolata]
MNTLDKGAIGDGFEDVASPIAANEAVSKSDQEDDGIVIATPSESWVLLDSKSDDEEVTLDEASTASRRQPGLIAAAVACALVVAAAGAFAATRPSAVVKPPPPPPPVKRFVLASALDSVAAAAAKVRADGIDAQFELATGLDGKLAPGGGRAARGAREALRGAPRQARRAVRRPGEARPRGSRGLGLRGERVALRRPKSCLGHHGRRAWRRFVAGGERLRRRRRRAGQRGGRRRERGAGRTLPGVAPARGQDPGDVGRAGPRRSRRRRTVRPRHHGQPPRRRGAGAGVAASPARENDTRVPIHPIPVPL